MDNSLVLVKLDSDYCDYLRKYDNKVPYNFGGKSIRPFVGVLFYVDKLMYFAPLSSPKPKHLKLRNKIDFLKIDSGNLGAINFNNMLPVTDKNVEIIDLNQVGKTKKEKQYNKLLQKQMNWLNRHSMSLHTKSKKLYDGYLNGTLPESIKNRCCNFKLFEEKCAEYNK